MTNETQKITKIQAQKRPGRYNVYLNDKYAFPINEETFIHFRLSKGMEVTKHLIEKINDFDNMAQAYNKALTYLTRQLRTQKEVEMKLKQLSFSDEVIEQVIAKLLDLRLLNDGEYAKSYVRTMMKTSDKGPQYIIGHLRQKGVLENDIENALELFDDDSQVATALKVGQKMAEKNQKLAVRQQILKIKQRLLNKGFRGDVIEQAIQQLDLKGDPDLQNQAMLKITAKILRKNHGVPDYQKMQKIKQALYQKGYDSSQIEIFMADNVNLDED